MGDDLLEKDKNFGFKALVGDTFIKQNEVFKEDVHVNIADSQKRSQGLGELENLRKQLHQKFAKKEMEFNKLELLCVELQSKSRNDEEFENEVKTVLKLKQERILELERDLKVSKEENLSPGSDDLNSQNCKLKEELEGRNNEIKVMEERINHVKELVSVSAAKIKSVKQKEDHFKSIESENDQLKNSLSKVNGQLSILVQKVGMLEKEIKGKDEKIHILKETNANLEQEVNIAMDSSRISDVDNSDETQVALKVRDEEISRLREKVRTLTSQSFSLQNTTTETNEFESLLKLKEEELNLLKRDKKDGANQLSRKYEAILIEKDKELFSLKEQSLASSNSDEMKTEFKAYFDELEKKSRQFMSLIKEQQKEISILKRQQLPGQTQGTPMHPMVPRQLRPKLSQVPHNTKARIGNLSDINFQRFQSPPPPAPFTNSSPLPDLVSFSKAGVAQYDQAPRYSPGQGHLPPPFPNTVPFTPQPSQPFFSNLKVPGEALLERSLPVVLPPVMPLLEGPFSFD